MNIKAIVDTLNEIQIAVDHLRIQVTAASQGDILVSDEMIELGRAAQLARTSLQNVRRWTIRHELGEKIGGRWMVDRNKLARYLNKAV